MAELEVIPANLFWQPGMHLFSRVTFRVKALMISLAFLVPIALLAYLFVVTRQETSTTAELELQGVAYENDILPMVKLARDYRTAVMTELATGTPSDALAATRQQIDAKLADLKKRSKNNSQFDTNKLITPLETLFKQAAPASEGIFKVFSTHGKFNSGVTGLMTTVADESGLTLDPELTTYYLMDASLNQIPTLLDSFSRSKTLAASLARSGKDAQLGAIVLSQEEGLVDYVLGNLNGDLDKVIKSRPDLKQSVAIDKLGDKIAKFRDMVTDEPGSGGPERAQKIDALGDELIKELEAVQAKSVQNLDKLLNERKQQVRTELVSTLLLTAIFILAAAYLFGCFIKVVDHGLDNVRAHMDQIAQGDLTASVRTFGRDETSLLAHTLDDMQSALLRIVGIVRECGSRITDSSQNVSSGSEELASRTQETLQRLQTVAAAMVEISGTVQSTADNAQRATQLSIENAALATRGGNVVQELVSTMDGIRESSTKIRDIIGVIDAIAFQTNILALNAAVEAARAGESGRGFAVVASEVRNLAQRSAQAANEIKQLITDSVDRVEGGNKVVVSAGDMISQIVESAKNIELILSEISHSMREQSTGVKQVEMSIQDLDAFAAENSSQVNETARDAQEMNGLAVTLAQEVSRFKMPLRIS